MNDAANKLPAVAIVGRPNVGKSALFNRLIGRKIAIVHDQPGITRDRISATCTRGTRPFVLWDTGGLFGAGEVELTAQVRRTAGEAFRDSDLLLFVVDAKEGLSPIDEEVARSLRKSQKPVILVINKIDNEKHEPLAAEFDALGFKTSIAISAEHDRGILDLLDAIDPVLPSPTVDSRFTSHKSLAVSILGRPNVGKSSLINSIVHSERAIVSELPGTTRDAVDVLYQRGGRAFVFIDTAGIRRRGRQSTSVEVFSVMRAERSSRRADLCILVVDLAAGVTAQDKRIGGLIQAAHKAAIIILNKWDLVKTNRNQKQTITKLVEAARQRIFFLDYAQILITSSLTGEHVSKLFGLIEEIQSAARQHVGTGVLNRLLRQAFEANPPPTVRARRLKLFYAAQSKGKEDQQLQPPEFVLFVNDPRLLTQTYKRYLESQIRDAQPFPGLPIILTLRPRAHTATPASRLRAK
ncbi:MAG TPA: ribosome biogenesis GTPase Der [Candidatus Udaeobacter sp.]|jgi:GTP-binding protein|nr:ribosome biogenesis GTPase Der [Candidatus Udaeobacter sp.]